ncbi:hypothetical protein [Fulvivirga lutimaris]|uniref:hypothetical protein n=1 Tax=Fulvivirga lutimaris TaxID=1819566 RepID=UPI0012BD7C4B|nr:hypothetical protein [Fulvivirga lutimaris]MTI38529.1 hypothetical protein [Fulvivirga lutimaris]
MGLGRFLLIGLIILQFKAQAQTVNFQEEVYISVDKTNVIVGELLNFSAFVYSNTSKKLSKLSSILYIELIDEVGTSVHQTKIGLRNGRGSGSIYIDSEWLSSTYRLVAYTRWMQNYNSYFEQKILILNPYNNLIQHQKILGNPMLGSVESTVDANRYDIQQQASLSLGIIQPSSISISISKMSNLYYSNVNLMNDSIKTMKSFKILPEYKYGLVQGNVNNTDSQLRINSAINGSNMQISTTITDSAGNFWINYNPDLSPNDAEIQIELENDSLAQISIVNEFYKRYSTLDTVQVTLDSITISELILRSVNNQIQMAYQKPLDVLVDTRSIFTLPSAEVYYLDDYKRFPSLRDTFIELLNNVGVSKSDEKYRINIRCNSEPSGLNKSDAVPLILLDGLKITPQYILNISPNSIMKIEVIPEYYFVNDIVYKGIISVHSFKGNMSVENSNSHTFPIANYQPYNEAGYQLRSASRIPQYQTDLFWDPIYSHNGGELLVNFSTSMIEGTYKACVKGLSEDGIPINVTKYFQVILSSR